MEARQRVTLNTLARFAGCLHRIRGISWLTLAGASVWFVVAVVRTTGSSVSALGALSLLLWAALALGIGSLLSRPPPAFQADDRWRRRVGKRLRWACYWIALAVALGLGAMAASMSLRAVRLAFG